MFLFQAVITPNSNPLTAGAMSIATDAAKFLQAIDWRVPSWDMFIVLFFMVTVFLYGISLGRDRVIVILISIYMAMAVVSNAPFLGQAVSSTNIGQLFAFRITTFIGLFVLLFFLMSRSALMNTFGNLAAGRWWQVFIFSIFHVGLLVSVTLSFLPSDAIGHLAPLTQVLFASQGGKFFWIVVPIAAMVTLKP